MVGGLEEQYNKLSIDDANAAAVDEVSLDEQRVRERLPDLRVLSGFSLCLYGLSH